MIPETTALEVVADGSRPRRRRAEKPIRIGIAKAARLLGLDSTALFDSLIGSGLLVPLRDTTRGKKSRRYLSWSDWTLIRRWAADGKPWWDLFKSQLAARRNRA